MSMATVPADSEETAATDPVVGMPVQMVWLLTVVEVEAESTMVMALVMQSLSGYVKKLSASPPAM